MNTETAAASVDTYFRLIRDAPFGVYLVDADFRLAQMSTGCSKVFAGIDPLLDRDFGEILRTVWTKDFAEEAIAIFRNTLITGESYHSPKTTELRGNIRVVESYDWQIQRVTMPDGRFGVVCYFYETTDQVNAEQDAIFLAKLSEHCRISTNGETLLRHTIREVGEYLGVDRCFVNEISIEEDRWTILYDYHTEGSQSLTGDHRLSDFAPAALDGLSRGVTDAVSDAKLDPTTQHLYAQAFEPLGVTAFVNVPLLREGSLKANFVVGCNSPHEWQTREIALLEAVAERLWNALERTRTDEDLRKFQERFDLVKDSVEIGFWFCDLPFDKLIWDSKVKEHFWLPPDAEVTIETFYEQIHPADREPTRAAIDKSIAEKGRYDTEYRTVSPANEIKLIRALGRTFYDQDSTPIRFDGITLDITALRRAENAIREREWLESLVMSQEAERQRIARDLHDQLGQELTSLRLRLAQLQRGSADSPEIPKIVTKAQETALRLDQHISSLAFQLRASELNEKGLTKALESLVEEWSRNYGIEAEFQAVVGVEESIPSEIETHIYRIAQECLNNTTKYANATKVNVLLETNERSVRLIVEDDGVGFDPSDSSPRARANGHGLGLVGMRERAELLKGTLEIESTVGSGTSILLTVPRY